MLTQLGMPAQAVVSPGQKVPFALLLWCPHASARAALTAPEAVKVTYIRSEMFGLDVLDPHNSARKNRDTKTIGEGRVWRSGEKWENKEAEEAKKVGSGKLEVKTKTKGPRMVELFSEAEEKEKEVGISTSPVGVTSEQGKQGRSHEEQSSASNIRDAWLAKEADLTENLAGDTPVRLLDNDGSPMGDHDLVHEHHDVTIRNGSADGPPLATGSAQGDNATVNLLTLPSSDEDQRSHSPTPSFEDVDAEDGENEGDQTIRLDGEFVVPSHLPPSYRWMYHGMEVSIGLLYSQTGFINMEGAIDSTAFTSS
jgi:hypothetical protein